MTKRNSKPKQAPKPRALWTCPKCGRQFKMTNAYHACEAYSLESHFEGKPPAIRALYDHLIKAMKPFGPVLVYPVKTRIIFQAETQFAVVIPHKTNLELHLWLQRRAQHPLLYKFQMGVYRDYGHMFRLTDPAILMMT